MSWFPEQAGNGLDRMYHGLTQHLPDTGVSVQGVVAGSENVYSTSNQAVSAFASDSSSLLSRLTGVRRAVNRILQNAPVDLIASHFALYTAPTLPAIGDRPLVIHFHGPWAQESRVEGASPLTVRAKKWLENIVYRRGVQFIVLSSAFRDVLIREFDVSPEKIEIVPGGVHADAFDTGRSRQDARRSLGWPTDCPTIVAVRRLARRMGLENLIDALRMVRRRVPDVRLYVAGKGPLEAELKAQIERFELEDHVRLLGFVPEEQLPLVYRAADVSIVPTIALEGFGLITVESLAAGTPVLVTPHGGLPAVVSDLDPTLVLPGDTAEILASGLVQSLRGRRSLPSTAECQRYVRERFDWPVIAAHTRHVYETVLA
ncbi:glycosyltransferase family 4 protein [Salinibacter sp. 10B]|uniref:glycosyltransferase family 4 protein n=1 Tax=Salinibacter sp. 10B TaxID=1923971 RepID=UPI002157FD19|nr:glycosyltransferase family 4 protein [Salinibacter sp. 10B]